MDIKVPDFPELEFIDETHTYKLNGIAIPSVSEIISPLSNKKYDGISEKTLERAARKGTSVHNSIENFIKFEIDDVPEEHRGYFEGFLDWWEEKKPVVIGSEIKIYHKLLRYGGTIDLLCLIDDAVTLVDYKSTAVVSDMTCGVQLEGYRQALASHGIKIDRKEILHLKKDRKHKEIEYPVLDAERWKVFGSLKCVYDYIESCK